MSWRWRVGVGSVLGALGLLASTGCGTAADPVEQELPSPQSGPSEDVESTPPVEAQAKVDPPADTPQKEEASKEEPPPAGPVEQEDPPEDSGPVTSDEPKAPPELPPSLQWEKPEWLDDSPGGLTAAKLARFWLLDRYVINADKGVWTKERLGREVLAKAQPDECFSGVGGPIGAPPCEEGEGRPKTNDAYVWGLTLVQGTSTGVVPTWQSEPPPPPVEGALWFGTVANTHCLVQDGFLGVNTPQENDFWTCEFDQSTYPRPSPAVPGDLRPPNLFRYDLASKQLELKNPPPGSPADLLRRITIGLRSAGNVEGVVFLSGPTLTGGISMFAFDADTGELLGARSFPEFSNIRSWVTLHGVLYTGVALTSIPTADAPGGAVLRWAGQKSTDPEMLFRFDVVGKLDSEAANLAEHEGRLFVTTWPTSLPGSGNVPGDGLRYMGLWESPELGPDGLAPGDADGWKKLWDIREYETDPIVAAVTGGGALASFDGHLYWGTMHVPFLGTAAALQAHQAGLINLDANGNGNLDPLELLNTALGTHRSITLFQARDINGPFPYFRIIYGEKYLPRYEPAERSYTVAYEDAYLNHMKRFQPRWGSSGLGNFFNAYTWAMEVYDNHLYLGTFDWSQLARVGVQEALGGTMELPVPQALGPGVGTPGDGDGSAASLGAQDVEAARQARRDLLRLLNIAIPKEGADLFRFDDASRCAEAESLTGVGNFTNYGVRTMQASDAALFLGTANPMNLHPQGGWELLQLQRR